MTIDAPGTSIPDSVPYPGSADSAWDRIPLGVGENGEVAWEPSHAPHLLIAGAAGSGKSIIQRNLFLHALQHKDQWRFVGIDPKNLEFTPYRTYREVVLGVGKNFHEISPLLDSLKMELNKRHTAMKEEGADRFTDLKTPLEALLVVIDLFPFMLAPKASVRLKDTFSSIARQGADAGIYLVCDARDIDAETVPVEFKDAFETRIACGRMKEKKSLSILGTDAATRTSANRGRAFIQTRHGEGQEFQGYLSSLSWADDNLSYI